MVAHLKFIKLTEKTVVLVCLIFLMKICPCSKFTYFQDKHTIIPDISSFTIPYRPMFQRYFFRGIKETVGDVDGSVFTLQIPSSHFISELASPSIGSVFIQTSSTELT